MKRRARMHAVVSHQLELEDSTRSALPRPPQGRILTACEPSWQMQNATTFADSKVEQFSPHAADVWFGSHGTQVSRALSQSQAGAFTPKLVIGCDDRTQITDTQTYPFSAICALEITAQTGQQFVGTGWFANDNTVVTAGHCVYLCNHGGWARRVRVFPGRNGEGNHAGYLAGQLRSVKGWINDHRRSADYGAIQLVDRVPTAGGFGLLALNDDDLMSALYHVVGYPADKPRGTQWGHVRALSQVKPSTLYYATDTYGGNSGCPVFFVDDRQPEQIYAVGIHNYGDVSGNSATRITEEVFENICLWME
ncbi:MAG: trypsin-like peptidase domain-containing protein [Planctomycetota bacterium]